MVIIKDIKMSTKTKQVDNVIDNVDDNKLVTNTKKSTLWNNKDNYNLMKEEMKKLQMVRVVVENPVREVKFPEKILIKAMAEVFCEVGWSDYETYKSCVENILSNPHNVPCSTRTWDKETGKRDFWMIRAYIDARSDYVVDDQHYNKVSVLMSRQFTECLRDYCENKNEGLNNEVQFWLYTNSYSGNRHLDVDKIFTNEKNIIKDKGLDLDHLVMIQFKKNKDNNVFVGKN